jgi:hypothetical protein
VAWSCEDGNEHSGFNADVTDVKFLRYLSDY